MKGNGVQGSNEPQAQDQRQTRNGDHHSYWMAWAWARRAEQGLSEREARSAGKARRVSWVVSRACST